MFGPTQSVPWLWHALVSASVVTAVITPSNTTTAKQGFQGTLPLKQTDGQTPIADLVPLTNAATQRASIEGNLLNTNFSNTGSVSPGDIVYISCNPDDYSGFADADRVFQDAFQKANLSAVILYSTATDYCSYTHPPSQDMIESFPVLSMTNKTTSGTLRSQIASLPISMKYFVKVQGRGDDSNNNNNSQTGPGGQGQNPLGPSPSTAVAMIILYSITGIITALFLVIIVTGAIRAHRHPERYGPRDVLGRPRQSRARGLGRAILDTIPIVKFGEKEQDPTKPADIELASTAETRNVDSTSETGQQLNATVQSDKTSTANTARETGETQVVAATNMSQNHEEGIAPAAAAMPMGQDSSSHDENLGCSICTEDFEKGQDLRVLPCDHKFHPECVDPWLLNVSGTCPLCRVDLRPVTSHDSSASQDPDELNPSAADVDPSQYRRTAFRDILYFRTRPNATPQERIHALRRLREQRRARGEDTNQDQAGATTDTTYDRRRSRRISARLSDVFSSRPRRDRSPPLPQGEGSQTATQNAQPPRSSSPAQSSSNQRT